MKKITVEKVDVIYFSNQDSWDNLEEIDIKILYLSFTLKLELKSEVDVRLIRALF